MHTCFELPTYGRPDDEFNKTRKFWDCLRDAFYAAVTCSWIMCLDESMIKWLGRGMPGFMHVQRKPTPKGLELHTLCCAMCGIMLFFEVYEGKKAMEKKALCDEQKRKLGAKGPWKSVALTLRMVERFKEGGRVLIADSWFGSVACTLALYSEGIFAVMNVKTGHKDYPKDQLLGKLGYDKATKLCPKERRGEWFAFTRKFNTGPGQHCIILAAGHNSKKPVLVVSTAGTATPADDYTKTWTWTNAVGELVKYTIQVPTSIVHSLYHRFFHIVDVHNHLRQGLVSMADVWGTNHWADRHFAEGLGFWEVNVYKALQYFHPSAEYKTLGHGDFRKQLAHAFLTLGKAEFGENSDGEDSYGSPAICMHHEMQRFDNYVNEKHQCGFCAAGISGYFYCKTCFPDGRPTHAFCNPTGPRKPDCYSKHCAGVTPLHTLHLGIKKAAIRGSPRRARTEGEETPGDAPPPAARRRLGSGSRS